MAPGEVVSSGRFLQRSWNMRRLWNVKTYLEPAFLLCVLVLGGAVTAACAPAASDAELQARCGNLVTLRGEVDTTTMEERTAKIEEDFAKRAQLHKDQQAAAE